LALTGSAGHIAGLQQMLENAAASWLPRLPHLETKVRQGAIEEILFEAQSGNYEIVVLGQTCNGVTTEPAPDSHDRLRRLLGQAGIPVLLTPALRHRVGRILICTAAGEPGKSDVRFGGRVARRTGAEVTVFHVLPAGAGAGEQKRVERHLMQAQASLEALGVVGQVKTETGTAVEQILREAEAGDYDLIVIGTPPPGRVLASPDLSQQIAAGANRPVLLVPMSE
jgi:nucleotide-binding universal stress UspA family protein